MSETRDQPSDMPPPQTAKDIFLDLIYDSPGTPAEDQAFERALAQSGRVTLGDRGRIGCVLKGKYGPGPRVLGRRRR